MLLFKSYYCSTERMDSMEISSTYFTRIPIDLNEAEITPCREVVFENPATYLLTRTTFQPPPPLPEYLTYDTKEYINECKNSPVAITCPRCCNEITTEVRKEMGLASTIVCILLFIFGFGIGILAFPFISDKIKDSRHVCPSCSKTIHIDTRI